MSLPVRATLEDIQAVCGYLATKPTGASSAEIKAVVDKKHLDVRKLSALRSWGLVDENDGRLKLTEAGRVAVKDGGAYRSRVLRRLVENVAPYRAVVERAVHRGEATLTANDVATHWHEHFKDQASATDEGLNNQAVCFFQVAEGADLGQIIIGRRGSPTRFNFDLDAARTFVDGSRGPQTGLLEQFGAARGSEEVLEDLANAEEEEASLEAFAVPEPPIQKGNRVFITHGKNKQILDQMKEIVAFGKFEPVVAQERETAAKPVPGKVMDDMRSCQAAVIHVGLEGVLYDGDGNEHPQVNGNVLIEIGAAMALYKDNFILLVEDGVKLPSNLQGLYECRYKGDGLDMQATMKLLKAFNEFK